MSLADQIIEHGPVRPGTLHHAQLVDAMFRPDAFNELRDELIAGRALRRDIEDSDGFCTGGDACTHGEGNR